MDPEVRLPDNDEVAASRKSAGIITTFGRKETHCAVVTGGESRLKLWELIRDDEAQGLSEYAMLLVLLVLIIVAAVHALGMDAQQVIDRVNTALHG